MMHRVTLGINHPDICLASTSRDRGKNLNQESYSDQDAKSESLCKDAYAFPTPQRKTKNITFTEIRNYSLPMTKHNTSIQ